MPEELCFKHFGRALCAAVFVVMFLGCAPEKTGPVHEFADLQRGTLERTVSSTGTINPVTTVKVLPRMSGKVEKIYVDYNDTVRRGAILAELNTDMLRLKREQQIASVIKARSNYELQRINYRSQQNLAEKNLISEYELKTGKTALDGLAADLAIAEASLKVIETEINQYAFITSPFNGIVLDRNINVGDTVVDSSNNNSTSIFTLAENLREMQIEAGVGELDVASIFKGQQVRFTVESLPGRTFAGIVETLRLVPVVQNNVVSYTVIVNVENEDNSLLPGMTCQAEFIVERKENILIVPNAALRYQPTSLSADAISDLVFNASLENMNPEQQKTALEERAQAKAAADQKSASSGTGLTGMVVGNTPPGRGGPGGMSGRPQDARVMEGGTGRNSRAGGRPVMRNLWFINGEGKHEVIQIQAGITNGSFTEIISTENLEGRQVILREKI